MEQKVIEMKQCLFIASTQMRMANGRRGLDHSGQRMDEFIEV